MRATWTVVAVPLAVVALAWALAWAQPAEPPSENPCGAVQFQAQIISNHRAQLEAQLAEMALEVSRLKKQLAAKEKDDVEEAK